MVGVSGPTHTLTHTQMHTDSFRPQWERPILYSLYHCNLSLRCFIEVKLLFCQAILYFFALPWVASRILCLSHAGRKLYTYNHDRRCCCVERTNYYYSVVTFRMKPEIFNENASDCLWHGPGMRWPQLQTGHKAAEQSTRECAEYEKMLRTCCFFSFFFLAAMWSLHTEWIL